MRKQFVAVALTTLVWWGLTSSHPTTNADIRIYPEKSQSSESQPEPLTVEKLQKLLLQNVICSVTHHDLDAKVADFHLSKYEFRNRIYHVLAKYTVNGRPCAILATVRINPQLKRWFVYSTSSGYLNQSRGFNIFANYVSEKTLVIGGYINHPQIVKLRVYFTQREGTTVKVVEIPADKTRVVFKVIQRAGAIEIDGLNKNNQVLYGWG